MENTNSSETIEDPTMRGFPLFILVDRSEIGPCLEGNAIFLVVA